MQHNNDSQPCTNSGDAASSSRGDASGTSHASDTSDTVDEPSNAQTGPLAGLPKWITPELIRQTIRVWQPYYKAVLTMHDAAAMLLNVGRLSRILAAGA